MNKNGRHIEEGADVLDEETLISNIQDDYEYSFSQAKKYLDIAVSMKLEHDNAVDPRKIPTRSKISIPHKFAQVEEFLSKYHELLWPPSNPVRAIPTGANATIEGATKVANGLYHMVKDRMGCPEESLPIERDCAKVGFGYGVIEPFKFQRLEPFKLNVAEGGKSVGSSTEMDVGDPISSLRLRYISPGQIIPYPDGCSTNGHSRASTTFFWDFETERNFRNMCSEESLEGLDFDTANLTDAVIDDVCKKAKQGDINFVGGTFSYIAKLGGLDYESIIAADDQAQATIPILKVYREGEHIWLANGETLIYRQAAKAQTYRCPILKMCAVRDAMHWYPYTVSEALMDVNWSRNVWLNMITDIMTWSAKRPLIYSTSAFEDAPEYGPDSMIPTSAPNARDGAAFLAPPSLANGDLQLGQILDERADSISGNKDFTQKNFSRGGQNAFNDLLNASNGRDRNAGVVIEGGFMRDLYTQVLIYMQIDGSGYTGNTIEFDEKEGKEKLVNINVTGSDMQQSFDISVSLDAKRLATEFSVGERIQMAAAYRNNPMADPYEVARFEFGNDELTHRIIKSKDKADAIQKEDRTDSRAAVQAGIEKAQGQPSLSPEIGGAMLGGAPEV